MLYFAGVDAEGVMYGLTRPVSVSIRAALDEACDRFSGKFLWKEGLPEFRFLLVSRQENLSERYFYGAVDSQKEVVSDEGRFLQISARSLAFSLEDNEMLPTVIPAATPLILFYYFVRSLGFNMRCDDMNLSCGDIVVHKGDSVWDVLEVYSRRMFERPPRVNCYGEVWVGGYPMNQVPPVTIGDGVGIFIAGLTTEKRRGDPISEVVILSPEDGSELQRVTHPPTVEKGIQRRVCLVADGGLESAISDANVLLQKAAENCDRVEITCLGAPPTELGEVLHVDDSTFGVLENFLLTEVSYELSGKGEVSHLVGFCLEESA